MAVTVTATLVLADSWATEAEINEMTDEEILELLNEDMYEMTSNATWTVSRGPDAR